MSRPGLKLYHWLLVTGVWLAPGATASAAGDQQEHQQWLLDQVRAGEALHRDDLVEGALTRLERLNPNDPQVLLVTLRLALRRQDNARALALLERLRQQQPYNARLVREGEALVRIQTAAGQAALQQARLLALAGHHEKAIASYDALFAGDPPDFATALEYWRVRSNLKGQRPKAIQQLQQLDRGYPENVDLRQTLTNLLFAEGKNAEALRMLGHLAEDPIARDAAAQREFDYLSNLPPSAESVRAWQGFLQRYPHTPLQVQARTLLDQQQTLVADPAWRAGQRGQQVIEQDQLKPQQLLAAEADLRHALKRYPNDPRLYGALGLVLLRQGGHAEEAYKAFNQAALKEQDTYWITKWRDLRTSTEYWMLLQRAEKAVEAQNRTVARSLYQQARKLQPKDTNALIGLGELALAEGKEEEAERLLLQARHLDSQATEPVRLLVKLYAAQSSPKAEAFIASLSEGQRRNFAKTLHNLKVERLTKEADAAALRSDKKQLVVLLKQIRDLEPDDPWLTYRLANTQKELGLSAEAESSFQQLLQTQGRNPIARYAHGLYLESEHEDSAVMDSLAHIPEATWTEDMQSLAQRARRRLLREQVEALYAQGRILEAETLLLKAPAPEPADLLQVADWSAQREDYPRAEAYYQEVLKMSPQYSSEARLGLAEVLLAQKRPEDAKAILAGDPLLFVPDQQSNSQRRLASLWVALEEPQKARALFEHLIQNGQGDALFYRDAARHFAADQPDRALDLYAHAMAKSELLTPEQAKPRDNRALTEASRAKDEGDWLQKSLRNDVDELYQAQNPTLHVYQNYGFRNDNATSGTSDLVAQTTMVQLDVPIAQGKGFVRTEYVDLDAGRFKSDGQPGVHHETFGTCALLSRGCPLNTQHDQGLGVAIGWENERWAFDFGHSPQGFEVSNWLGGVTYKDDWNILGWELTASRRPMSNSLVSYAGAVDPNTGIRWGGVTANGFTLGLSVDEGTEHGLWASLGYHWLRGKNVADNSRHSAMAGYYYRITETANERLRTGLTLMYWGYRRDLSEYTLGQGGYYSPQQYYSFGIPLTYAWRNADWSVSLEGSWGWSRANTDSSDLYPEHNVSQWDGVADGARLKSTSGTSTGQTIRLQGALERRLSDHLVLGGAFSWQQAENYAPGYGSLYLRYTFDAWQGNLPLPIEPLTPYADFR